MNTPNKQVSRWRPQIREARDILFLPEHDYPDDVVLALIDVESDGDPEAHRDGSQFHGLLQMGQLAGIDVGFEDRGRETTAALDGDGYTAILECLRYLDRYRQRHRGVPGRIALLWKAGPGTCSRVNEYMVDGKSFDRAVEKAAAELGVPNALEYVRRFRKAREVWSEWLAGQEVPPEVCVEP